MLAVLLGRGVRLDTGRNNSIIHPHVPSENRPVEQQPRVNYHNIPVVVGPDHALMRDPRQYASARVPQTAVGRFFTNLSNLMPRAYRGPDPSTAPRSVQVPR